MHLGVIESMQIPLRGATQPLGIRWGFETTSSFIGRMGGRVEKNRKESD